MAKSLMVIMGFCFDLFPDATELLNVEYPVVDLLLSKQLLLVSNDIALDGIQHPKQSGETPQVLDFCSQSQQLVIYDGLVDPKHDA